ncbi:hypothetical protein D3C71_1321030 [compost metagenome]
MDWPSACSCDQPYRRSALLFQKMMRCSRSRTRMASCALSSSEAWWRMRASASCRSISDDARAAKICSVEAMKSVSAMAWRNSTNTMPTTSPSALHSCCPAYACAPT